MAETRATAKKKSCFKTDKYNITWWTILSHKHSMFALMTCFVGTFNIVFWTAFIATALTGETYGLDDDKVGYVFGSGAFTYLAACLLLPYTCEGSPRKL